MGQKIDISATFEVIRRLPLQVSFEQVERWIVEDKKRTPFHCQPWWKRIIALFRAMRFK